MFIYFDHSAVNFTSLQEVKPAHIYSTGVLFVCFFSENCMTFEWHLFFQMHLKIGEGIFISAL